jgi:hypothetical protein
MAHLVFHVFRQATLQQVPTQKQYLIIKKISNHLWANLFPKNNLKNVSITNLTQQFFPF